MRYLHLTIFILSLLLLFELKHDALFSMIISELVTLYVIGFNLNRPEILPPLTFIVSFKIIEYPIAVALYGGELMQQLGYLGFLVVADILLVIALLMYRKPIVRRIFGVSTPALKIPQVHAMATLLLIAAAHAFCVMSEIAIYYFGWLSAESAPFFYRTFPDVRASLKMLMLLCIWSMMLDAHFNPFRNKEAVH